VERKINKTREFEFRAFYDGKMLPDTSKVGNALYWNNGRYFDLFAFKQKIPAVLMQYIGWKDKNDIEIYECDILKDDHDRIMLVVWHRYGFCFKAITRTNFIYACNIEQWFEYNFPCPVIIGNSYENPEIVKAPSH